MCSAVGCIGPPGYRVAVPNGVKYTRMESAELSGELIRFLDHVQRILPRHSHPQTGSHRNALSRSKVLDCPLLALPKRELVPCGYYDIQCRVQ